MEYLLELVDQVGLTDRVSFILNVPENGKWFILLKAKAIISAAHFEPFGTNVVEGMYAGCIPISKTNYLQRRAIRRSLDRYRSKDKLTTIFDSSARELSTQALISMPPRI